MSGKHIDHTGIRYGKLVCIKYLGLKNKYSYWLTKCDCGVESECRITSLVRGDKKSCGCSMRFRSEYKFGDEPAFYHLYNTYKQSSKFRNHKFELTKDEFRILISNNCYYCGESPSNIRNYKGYSCVYNGVDRVNNLEGYIPSNVVSCCQSCNNLKNSISPDMIEKVYKFIFEKKTA